MENNNKSGTVFYSYCPYPRIKFQTQEEGEKIILLLRSHPFTQVPWILNAVFLLIIVFILNFFVDNFFNLGNLFVVNLFAVVFVLSYIWFNILNWYFNVGIVTSKRIIDIDVDSILYREITVAQLDKIQDITVKSGGFFESFFDYGSVFSQTAGTLANVDFENVPYPAEAVQTINKLLSRRHGS